MAQPLALLCVPEGKDLPTNLSPLQRRWAEANGFAGQRGRLLAVPAADGGIASQLFGTGGEGDRPKLILGLAAAALEPGDYALGGDYGDPTLAALAFRLGAYRFDRYRKTKPAPTLDLPAGADGAEVARLADAAYLARDLVNTPANDLGPDAFEREIRAFASRHKMTVKAVVGDDLLTQNFPMIHAVGRAGPEAPRLLDLSWGRKADPKITLVGQGRHL